MRTTKRFTPTVLARFTREGRSQGSHDTYSAWHMVSRGDPASSGRSHLLNWKGRLRDLLSDGELGEQLFATMLPDLDDCLEQCKLHPEDGPDPLSANGDVDEYTPYPGTESLARELGFKHPRLHDTNGSTPWVMTPDLLLAFRPLNNRRPKLAIAFKPVGEHLRRRTHQVLQLEREYWLRRGVPWLLITPDQYELEVRLTLNRVACWALADELSAELRQIAVGIARADPVASVTSLLLQTAAELGSLHLAQCALWQSVWCGELPVDLRRGWRPHLPLRHLSPEAFRNLNPIASRRSAWT